MSKLSDKEIKRRADEGIRRALSTPQAPQGHEEGDGEEAAEKDRLPAHHRPVHFLFQPGSTAAWHGSGASVRPEVFFSG